MAWTKSEIPRLDGPVKRSVDLIAHPDSFDGKKVVQQETPMEKFTVETLPDVSFFSATDTQASNLDSPRKDEHIITTGQDVSRYLVDVRDDGGSAATFRSFALGTMFAGLGAALREIYRYKPIQMRVSTVFLLLMIYSVGCLWTWIFPKRTWVAGTRFNFLASVFHFINPGPFTLKEHVVANVIGSTAANVSSAVVIFAVQRLFYNIRVDAMTAILATFSSACFGYGLVGLLRSFAVYPSEMVYWKSLPTVSLFQAIHFDAGRSKKKLRLFWTVFTGMFVYEIIPAYIAPVLNGVNVFCLATQRASRATVDTFTNIFGGASGNEGLGLLSLSFDWQYIDSDHMSLPLTQQANAWIGVIVCYIAVLSIYYSNAWNARSFPMLSSSLFASNGSVYNQSAVFGVSQKLNMTTLDEIGLPWQTGANVWHTLCANLATGSLVAHVVLFWGHHVRESYKLAKNKTQPDPHYQAMQRYREAPWWWYALTLVLAFFAGLVVVMMGSTTVPWWEYLVSLILGSFIAPFSIILQGRMGTEININEFMKMVAGSINPGRPVANLYFSMWSHDVVDGAMLLAGDLKLGQYLKIPPRVMFVAQIWGAILGAFIKYFVMNSIVVARRNVLISPQGTHVWSGQASQLLNSAAVTWSLAKQLYGIHGRYWLVPVGLLLGGVATFIQWLIWKRWPKIGVVEVDSILLPIIFMSSAALTRGVTSNVITGAVVGLTSQLWLRRRRPAWYRKYNYILCGALDGGAQTMVFILSFAAFGASGVQHKFPHWVGNPARGNVDYCNGNGALNRPRH